jgi:hypothetical protein
MSRARLAPSSAVARLVAPLPHLVAKARDRERTALVRHQPHRPAISPLGGRAPEVPCRRVLAVATIDQALLGVLAVKHAHLRTQQLRGNAVRGRRSIMRKILNETTPIASNNLSFQRAEST